MSELLSKQQRSDVMRKVKSSNTSPEIKLRKELWKAGVRGWRLHPNKIKGKPDIVFNPIKLAIFIDGCFWHGCPSCYRRPSSNRRYWDAKLQKNIGRDQQTTKNLKLMGWNVLRLWEHEVLKSSEKCLKIVQRNISYLKTQADR